MKYGNGNFRAPKRGSGAERGPSMPGVAPDSSKFDQHFQGGHSFFSCASAAPQSPRQRGQISQQQVAGGHDLQRDTPSPPGMSSLGHTQHQQARGLRSVRNIQGYVAQMPPGHLNGAGTWPTYPVFSDSSLNGMEQQRRGTCAMMTSCPENLPFPPSWGEGPRRTNCRFDTGVLSHGDENLGLAQSLATRVYRDFLTGLNGVSTGKVAQATLLALGVPSFETMGVMPQDIPCLRKLAELESKVNTFFHAYVAGKEITTLYDLSLDLTRDEEVKEFEDLGLGPLLCHPLVYHYFSPPAGVEVHKITAGEVIQHLSNYIDHLGKDKTVQIEKFLAYVANERALSTPDHLCIRIQSLRMHMGLIRRSKRAEKELMDNWESRAKAEFIKMEKPSVIERVNLFLAAKRKEDASLRKRKFAHFSSEASPSSDDDSEGHHSVKGPTRRSVGVLQNSNRRCKIKLEDTCPVAFPIAPTTCPYPSAAEERARLKKQELQEFVANSEQEDFYLSSSKLHKFVIILKNACENHSVHEVLMKIIEMSQKNKETNKRIQKSKIYSQMSRLFKTYPAIGLLNVAILSVKAGYWDSMHKNFLDAAAETDGPLRDEIRSVQAAAPTDIDSTAMQSTPRLASKLPGSEEIVAAVWKHYEQYLQPKFVEETHQNMHRIWWIFLHWVYECENWIAVKHSVEAFSSLGFGSFSCFLEKHVESLPSGMISILGQKKKSGGLVAKVPKERLFSFLAQALPVLRLGGSLSQDHISGLLYRQFKVNSVEELGVDSLESLLEMSEDEQSRLAPSNHVFFLEPLLASCAIERIGEVHLLKENCPQSELPETTSETRVGVLGSMTSAAAAQCLLKAPFLADLSQWSQWHEVFAPTLGPLLDWFESEGSKSGLHAIVTCEGSLLRIDETATAESFLLATVKGSGDQMATVLMSLVSLYGGIANAPTALLKTHASKGLEILLGSCRGNCASQSSSSPCVKNTKREVKEHLGQEGKLTSTYRGGKPKTSSEPTASGSSILQVDGHDEEMIDLRNSVVSQCVMECLSCVIPELRIFTAEILLPALTPLIAGTPAALLSSCITLHHKSILHGVGLTLGIPEWINHYNSCAFGPSQVSAPFHILGPGHVEVDKSSWAKLKQEVSDELLNCNVRGSLVHAVKQETKKGCEHEETLANHSHDTHEADQLKRSPQHIPTDGSKMMQRTSGKGHEEGESKDMLLEKAPLDAQANLVIEEIRRYEFGVGHDISSEECDLIARQHARMGRALHRLSSDLYSQDSHFVLELVQNADDNAYNAGVEATLVFLIQEGRIVVLNNETGFTAANIRALCDVGNSTKAGENTGYIGHKGIGFKSVFRVTNAPEIHSNGFHVKFDISEGDLGFILPTWIPPPASDSGDDIPALMSEIEMPKSVTECWNTRINLPIKGSLRKGTGMSILASKFNDLHPSLLLFLHRLRCIVVHNDLMGSTVVMYREDCGEDLVNVVHETGTATWMVVRHQVKAAVHRPGITDTEIALAFQLNEVSVGTYESRNEQQQVFAFLPLRAYGLRFIVQGDFKVPSSREEVDCDSDWNQWLRSEIPDVFIKAAKAFQRKIGSGNPGKAVSSFMSFVPMEGEVLGFFSPLPRMILSTLRGSPCLPVEGGGWALPCLVLRGWNASTRQLLPDMFLNEHLGFCYLDKDVTIPDILALKLGVPQFGAGTLVAVMKSICQKKGPLAPLDLKWVEAWLLALHCCFESDQQSHHPGISEGMSSSIRLELQSLPYIPLSNGLFTSLSDGPVWFAGDLLDNGFRVSSVLNKFGLLAAELRIIHPSLFSPQNESVIFEESAGPATVLHAKLPIKNSLEKVVSILEKLGVSRLSEHEVLKNHVLPAMAKDDCLLKDPFLVVEYLGFSILHLESNCFTCSLEKFNLKAHLQKCAIILTSNGLLRAGQQPIHFSSAMGNNTLNMEKILVGTNVPWIEVSPLYVELQGSACDLVKWRNFFKDLGVTDFVKVVHTEKILLDKSASVWKTCVWEEEVAPEEGWIVQDWQSPELAQLLMNMNTGGPGSTIKEEQKLSFRLKERCESILVALDHAWDDYYNQFCKASYSPLSIKTMGPQKATVSTFLLLLKQFSWVNSSLDENLHVPTDLFRPCDAVESILGNHAPYVVTPLQSDGLKEALGFRTQVLVDDALQMLRYWTQAKSLFEASVAQMTRLYLFLWEHFPSHKEDVLSLFRSEASIFVPLQNKNDEEVQEGGLYTVGRVCWSDPINKFASATFNEKRVHCPLMPLSSIYHGLHDFFVGGCLVQEKPNFDGYLAVLRGVASEQPPSAVLSTVMEVFNLWSSEVIAGNVESSEILRWKSRLEEVESCIFATDQDKWVSLNHQTGLVCICDDEKLGEEFKESLGHVHFILMKDDDLAKFCRWNNYHKHKTIKCTLRPLVQALGIPNLSEVVERKVIKHGQHDSSKIEALVDWVLPYIQRYLKQHHIEQYRYLQGNVITEALKRLQFVVVDQLYFQYSLRNSVIRSNKRTQCTCILEDNTLHVVEDFVQDYCNIYAELSRLFFSGKSNLAVANFLHLITLMASSGSPENVVEGFIQNVQGIQPITGIEDRWTLSMGINGAHPDRTSDREGLSAGCYIETHVNQQKLRKNGTKGTVMVEWPPDSWKPLNGDRVAGYSEKMGQFGIREGVLNPSESWLQRDDGLRGYSSNHGALIHSHNQINPMFECKVIAGVEESSALKGKSFWDGTPQSMTMEHRDKHMFIDVHDVTSKLTPSYSLSTRENSCTRRASSYQELQRQSLSPGAGSTAETHSQAMDGLKILMHGADSMLVENAHEAANHSNFQDRDFLLTHSANGQQREFTGRSGEALVFRYLSSQYGPAHVKWLNQESETGAAYDIVVIRDSGQEEFVEVKTTRSGDKDWFEISTREWDFARTHAETFTIMRVFLSPITKQVRILRLPNPVKLAQDHVLQLALLLPASHANVVLESK